MEATVREAGPDDADAIAQVQVASWRAAYRGVVPDDFLDGMNVVERAGRWREGLTDRPGGQITYVAEAAERVVGFAAVGACRDPDATRDVGELYAIYVDPVSWRRGIGRALHASCMDGIRRSGYTEARLWVIEANPTARLFYEQLGWIWGGARQSYAFGDEELPIVRYQLAV